MLLQIMLKKVIIKNCAPVTNCKISKKINTEIDNAKYINIVMPMYNLIEYIDNYSKVSGNVWQYCKEIPAADDDDIVYFEGTNETNSFKFKTKITGHTGNDGRIDNVEIMVPLNYLSNFWIILEIPLINCEVNIF